MLWALITMGSWHGQYVVTGVAPMPTREVCQQYRKAVIENLASKYNQNASRLVVCADLSKRPVSLKGDPQ